MSNEQQSRMLNINDIAALKQIIDLASKRGAFQIEEFAAVGTVYSKLSQFLEAAEAQREASAQAQSQEASAQELAAQMAAQAQEAKVAAEVAEGKTEVNKEKVKQFGGKKKHG